MNFSKNFIIKYARCLITIDLILLSLTAYKIFAFTLPSGFSGNYNVDNINSGFTPIDKTNGSGFVPPTVTVSSTSTSGRSGQAVSEADIGAISGAVWEFLGISPPEEPKGDEFYIWQYWVCYNLGEKDRSISESEVRTEVDRRLKELELEGVEITKEWRESLNRSVRQDMAMDNMIDWIKTQGREISTTTIIQYLAGKSAPDFVEPYTPQDVKEILSELDLQIFVKPKFERLMGPGYELLVKTPLGGGVLSGLVVDFRKIREQFPTRPDSPVDWRNVINELFHIWEETKPLIEENLLHGEFLNLYEPSGTEFGFLRGYEHDILEQLKDERNGIIPNEVDPGTLMEYLYAAVRDGDFEQINRWIDWGKTKLMVEGRLLPVLERTAGHTFFDIMDKKSDDTKFFRYFEALVLKSVGLVRHGQEINPEDLIYKVQWGSFPILGNAYNPITDHPLNFLVTEGTSADEITQATTFDITFGNWSFINQLIFNASFSGQDTGAFEITIRNANGEETIFRIEDLQTDADGSKVIIPIWGPSETSWGDNPELPEYLRNSSWSEWLNMHLWEDVNGELVLIPNRAECKVVKVKDEITDWRNIEEVEIVPLDGITLTIDGIGSLSPEVIDLKDKSRVMSELDSGNGILIKAKKGARVDKPGSSKPLLWNPGFKDLNIGDINVLIIGRVDDKIKFVIPQYCNNILVMNYQRFIDEIWDGESSYIVYK